MRLIIILSFLFLISCCPKDGIDKSSTVNDYILAVDYYNDSSAVGIQYIPDSDISLKIQGKDGSIDNSLSFSRDPQVLNRIIFFFDQKWNDDLISSLSFKLSGFQLNQIPMDSLFKTSYQKAPVNISANLSNAWSSEFLCFLNQVGHSLLPSANAMSCKAKSGSTLSYRTGTLIEIDLTHFN